MKKLILTLALISSSTWAYVPTVESLFRHGSNPDISATGILVTMNVKRLDASAKPSSTQDVSLIKEAKVDDYFRIFYSRSNTSNSLRVAQTRYTDNSFSEGSLEHKIYYPNFTPFTVRATAEQAEKGIFYALMNSLVLNDGSYLMSYLKALGAPVRLNSDLINRDKLELMAEYKRYLVTINKDRNAKKTMQNPLRPDDNAARANADKIMKEPMYVDLNQVKLSREDGNMAWLVNAGTFEAVVSYKEREIQKIKFKSQLGDFEIICKDYWLANGTHSMPRYMIIRDFKGENYQVELTNLRHYNEREEDIVKRLNKWDQLLKTKHDTDPRPEFLL